MAHGHGIVHLTRDHSRRVDEIARDTFRFPTIVLMENAARSASVVAWKMLGGKAGRVVVLVGPGNNGGDGLAVARHLSNRGCEVICALVSGDSFHGDALAMFEIARAMGLPLPGASPALLEGADLVVDAMFGTGLTRSLAGVAADLALATHECEVPVLALDIPSGLDADTGLAMGSAVKATTTVTFVAPKIGFLHPGSKAFTGEIVIGDIGIPPAVVEEVLRAGK